MRPSASQVWRDIVQLAELPGEGDVALVVEAGVAEDDDAVLYIFTIRYTLTGVLMVVMVTVYRR